jgi:3-dehydroquinate synthase
VSQLPVYLTGVGIATGRCLIVSDENVGPLHAGSIEDALREAGWECSSVYLPPGETTKSLHHLSTIIDAAIASGLDRRSPIIAVGGGVVGDVAGFAASVVLRGVPLIQIPTSLIAQVDSAIGGKTGINHASGKNLVGAFYQPSLVLVDTTMLDSLPQAEWVTALSEVVKYGLIRDPSLVSILSHSWQSVMDRDRDIVFDIVRRCAEIKVDIVMEDEYESGVRAILNFGHTFGHALEARLGYREVSHGLAVAVGMRAAVRLSEMRYPTVDFSEAHTLLEKLPHPSISQPPVIADLIAAMQTDKKRVGTTLRLVLLDRVGSAVVVDDVSQTELEASWSYALDLSKKG